MAIIKDSAQVLRVFEQGNSSLVIVFLARRLGQVRVLAKGGRRWAKQGFAGGFDLLAAGELLAYPRPHEALWILKEWDERRRHLGLGESVERLRAASFLCEFGEALTRETAGSAWAEEEGSGAPRHGHARLDARRHMPAIHDAAPREALYDELAAAATALAAGAPAGPVLLAFVLRALEAAGLLPDLSRCSSCGRALPHGGGPALLGPAGLECQPCASSGPIQELPGEASRPALSGGTFYSPKGRGETARTGTAPSPSRWDFAGALQSAPGVWLSPEALGAAAFVKRTGRAVKLSAQAAGSIAGAVISLVHATLERDLRTLGAAANAVKRMGARTQKR
jgi:recombinational DNA repair protein (RecF pathway)